MKAALSIAVTAAFAGVLTVGCSKKRDAPTASQSLPPAQVTVPQTSAAGKTVMPPTAGAPVAGGPMAPATHRPRAAQGRASGAPAPAPMIRPIDPATVTPEALNAEMDAAAGKPAPK